MQRGKKNKAQKQDLKCLNYVFCFGLFLTDFIAVLRIILLSIMQFPYASFSQLITR